MKICRYKLILGFSVPFLLLALSFGLLGKLVKAETVLAEIGECNWGEQAYNLQSWDLFNIYESDVSATTTLTAISVWGWDLSDGNTNVNIKLYKETGGGDTLVATSSVLNITSPGGNLERKMTFTTPIELAPNSTYYIGIAATADYGWCRSTINERMYLNSGGNFVEDTNHDPMYKTAMTLYTEDVVSCVRPYEDIDGVCVRDPNNNYAPIVAGSAWYSVYQDSGQILNFYYSYRTDYGIMSGDYIRAYLCDEITATTTSLSDICTEPIIFWDNTISATSSEMRIIPTSGYEPPSFLRNNTYFQMIDPGFTISSSSEYVIRDILVVPIWHATSSLPLVGQDNLFTVWWYPENSTSTALVWSDPIKPKQTPQDMACTAEEWASGDWWVNIKCGFFSTWISVSQVFADMISSAVFSTGESAKVIFPFNLIANFISSWNDSATAALPEELEWIDFTDGEGNVYIYVPSAWAGTSTPMLIWGTDVFVPDGSPQKTFFGHIRTLLKYLLYAAFVYALYNLGEDIYNEVAYEEYQAKRRKEDLQL